MAYSKGYVVKNYKSWTLITDKKKLDISTVHQPTNHVMASVSLALGVLLATGCGWGSGSTNNTPSEINTTLPDETLNFATVLMAEQVWNMMENQVIINVKASDMDGLVTGSITLDGQIISLPVASLEKYLDSNITIKNLSSWSTFEAEVSIGGIDGETSENDEVLIQKVSVKTSPQPTLDTTAPTLSSTTKTFATTIWTPLTLENVTATDNKDVNLIVTQTWTVDFGTVWTYIITYEATDKAWNTSTIKHTFIVNEAFEQL